jgi:predicted transcriptional regulator
MRTKHTFRLPPDLMTKLSDYASRKGVSQSMIVEAALASHLSPDGADRLEAALARRLDRIGRHLERIERHVDISNEALAVFVRFWLTSTPPLPDNSVAAAQAKGRERYEGFVEALGRRLARGRKLANEVIADAAGSSLSSNGSMATDDRGLP